MSRFGLALRQVRYENKSFSRNPPAAVFTFAFPLMFLVIFNGLFGESQFFVPSIAAFSIISACYTNIAITVSFARDEGILKRVRGTPLPAGAYLFGRIAHATLIAILLVAIVVVAGMWFYDVDPPTATLGQFLLSLAVGAATFCALGLALTSLVPNAEAAPAIVNASILPLLFVSNVFYPATRLPDWLKTLAELFPPKHFADSMLASFGASAASWDPLDVALVAAWGAAGALIAARFFTWEPRR